MVSMHTFPGLARTDADSKSPDQFSGRLNDVATRAISFAGASGIWIASVHNDLLHLHAAAGTAVGINATIPLDGGLADICIQSGRIVRSDDLDTDRRAGAAAYRSLGAKSMLMVPVKSSGKVTGLLAALSPTVSGFTRTHVAVLLTLADVVAEVFSQQFGSLESGSSRAPVKPAPDVTELLAQQIMPPAAPTNMAAPANMEPVERPALPPSYPAATVNQFASPGLRPAEPRNPESGSSDSRKTQAPVFSSGTLGVSPLRVSSSTPANARSSTPAPVSASEQKPQAYAPATRASEPVPVPLADSIAPSSNGSGNVAIPDAALLDSYLPASYLRDTQLEPTSSAAPTAPVSSVAGNSGLSFGSLDGMSTDSSASPFVKYGIAIAAVVAIGIGAWTFLGKKSEAPAPQVQWSAPAAPQVAAAEPPAPSIQIEFEKDPGAEEASAQEVASPKKLSLKESAPRQDSSSAVETTAQVGMVRLPTSARLRESTDSLESVAAPGLSPSGSDLPQMPKVATSAPTPKWEVVPAVLVQKVQPVYPQGIRTLNVDATVILKVDINESGAVSRVRALHGRAEFQNAAMDAVRQWRYKPATVAGQAVKSTAEVELKFRSPASVR